MRFVKNYTETLVCCYQGTDSNEVHGEREDSPPARHIRKGQADIDYESEGCMGDTHGSDKENARFVSITNGPTNEIGVRLTTKGDFDNVESG